MKNLKILTIAIITLAFLVPAAMANDRTVSVFLDANPEHTMFTDEATGVMWEIGSYPICNEDPDRVLAGECMPYHRSELQLTYEDNMVTVSGDCFDKPFTHPLGSTPPKVWDDKFAQAKADGDLELAERQKRRLALIWGYILANSVQ